MLNCEFVLYVMPYTSNLRFTWRRLLRLRVCCRLGRLIKYQHSNKHPASFFTEEYPKVGGRMLLRNTGSWLPNYTASRSIDQPRSHLYTSTEPLKIRWTGSWIRRDTIISSFNESLQISTAYKLTWWHFTGWAVRFFLEDEIQLFETSWNSHTLTRRHITEQRIAQNRSCR
jgi:hypothetical protein